MTEQSHLFRPHKWVRRFGVCAALASAVYGTGLPLAHAQSEEITVDLSVLNDGHFMNTPSAPQGRLLIPPRRTPGSELHVAPSNPVTLGGASPRTVTTPAAEEEIPASQAKPMEAMKPAAPAQQPPQQLAAPEAMPKPEVTTETAPAPAPPPVSPTQPAAEPKPRATESPAATPAVASAPAPEPEEETATKAPALPSTDAPPSPPKVAAAPQSEESAEQASTTPQAVEIAVGQGMRIEFEKTATKMPDSAKEALRKIADGVSDKKDMRLQLMAYANAEGLSASKARRLSLSRALSVRSFLIENGVRSTRIDVRALGSKTEEKPANRVDVAIAKR